MNNDNEQFAENEQLNRDYKWKQGKPVGMRLVKYALLFKKPIIAALVLLTVAVAAELAGPFIAKQLIDTHMMGIEKPWHEISSGTSRAVQIKGKWYIREDRIVGQESNDSVVRFLQVGREFYFIPQQIAFDGLRSINRARMTIKNGSKSADYPAEKLSKQEVFALYAPEISPMVKLLTLYFGLIVISALFSYAQKYLLQQSANRIIQRMRRDVHSHIHRLPIHYFDNLPAGKVVSRVTNDTESIRELYVTVLANFFTSTIYITGILIALFLLDVGLALICLILLPILVVWIMLYRKYASKFNHIIRARLSDINGMLNESIQGMPIIRAFRQQRDTEAEFKQFNEAHFTYQNKLLNLNSFTSHNLVGFLRNITFTVLIWYFGRSALDISSSAVSLGVLYAFVDYLNRLFQPITGLVNQLANLEQARVSAERVFELMDQEGIEVAKGSLPRYNGNVSFANVSFAYKADTYVLRNISFEAKQGQTVALVGHTGSGKSSILNVLFRFYDAQKGTIRIDGVNTQDIPRQHLRQHMGIVLQDPFLFTGTIASNVSLEDPLISRDKIEQALREVGAWPFVSSLRLGMDEPVIEKGSTLSAGQRQLISFARALAFDPAILILDEATASIDTETEAIIQDGLEVLKKGRTTFIIAHRLSTIRSADLILVLHHGEVVERGSHDTLMQAGGRYQQMYKLQLGMAAQPVG